MTEMYFYHLRKQTQSTRAAVTCYHQFGMKDSHTYAKIRKKEENYFLSDMNSRNGTSVNGRLLRPDEEYQLEPEDEVDFAQARYIFLE